ncbi:MAG: methyltransferase domain-containing protein [Thalassobaculum sp.]|uniref:class I SAM-dependent methyltransferase n=1 Tax=Thalassobaculum sp. TaxID=2022740 RepID=UPI0032EF6630
MAGTEIPTGVPQGPGLRLNVGCGFNKLDGYVNVDSFEGCNPDVVWDLERTPWPFPDDSVDEIVAIHVLEHIGQQTQTFFAIIKEIYRIVRHGGEFAVAVPHPLHRSFIIDPTHVRGFGLESFEMLSRDRNLKWTAANGNITMLALMLDVDFAMIRSEYVYDSLWRKKLAAGEVTKEELQELSWRQPGVVSEIRARMRVQKGHRQPAA